MTLQYDRDNKPIIRNQADYDEFLNTLPNRRRKSGLVYDETHKHLSVDNQVGGRDKRERTADQLSEFREIDSKNRPGKYYGSFYDNIANKRLEDNVNYYSLKDLILANQQANKRVNPDGSIPNLPYDPHNVLRQANLHLTNAQITDLIAKNPSDARVYSPRMIVFGTTLKEAIDSKGWTVKRVTPGGQNEEDLRFTVASGNNQIDILGFTPKESRLGNFYVNRNSVFRSSHGLARVHNSSDLRNTLMPQIEYFMEGVNKRKYHSYSAKPADSSRLENTTTVRLMGDKPKKGNAKKINYDYSFNIGHNMPVNQNTKDSKLTQMRMELYEPTNLTELVENAYAIARTSSDENEVDSLVDLETITFDDGTIDMDQVDMEVVIRHSNMTTIMRLVNEAALRRVKDGEPVEKIREELVLGREGAAKAHGDQFEFSEDSQVDGLDTDAMDESADNGAFVQQGARERIANHMVGMTDESGDPLAGWLALESDPNREDYEKALQIANEAADEAGVVNFNGRFDNDGVLHWKGHRVTAYDADGNPETMEPVQYKLGQFFFAAQKDEFDDAGNMVRKEGVLQLKRGNGADDLRVDNHDVSFVPPTENRAHILERMMITGVEQKMHSSIHSSIKSQFLTRYDDTRVEQEELYDPTRINRSYDSMARIDRNRMTRPHVVEHLRNSFLIDKSYLDRSNELKEVSEVHKSDVFPDHYYKPQSVRLMLRGLEGVYDAQASSDGETLGLRGYFTEEFSTWLEESRDDKRFTFDRDGRLGMIHYDGGEKSPLEKWFAGDYGNDNPFNKVSEEIPNLKPLSNQQALVALDTARNNLMAERSKAKNERSDQRLEQLQQDFESKFLGLYETTRDHRYMFASPMVRQMREKYAQFDSPDRVLMSSKMLEVADSVEKDVNMTMASAGGLTFEDGIVISKAFAEEKGFVVGDKLADMHSNKGVVTYISGLTPGDVGYNKDAEQLFIDAERAGVALDMVQSPHGFVSRGNMGLAKEMMEGYHNKSADERDVYYTEGPHKGELRAKVGSIAVINTNMKAVGKTNLYEIQDLGRHRTFSYQQMLALQSHGATKTLEHILGNSEKKHADLLQYENVIGIQTTRDNQLVRGHFGMQDASERHEINGTTIDLEVLDDNSHAMLVMNEDVRDYGLPSGPAYLQLPVARNAYLKDDATNPVQTTYLPLLPERLRRETKSYDGEYMEHDYTMHMLRVADDFSSKIEEQQMKYLLTYEEGLNDFKVLLDDDELTTEDIERLYAEGDPEFMKQKALYPFSDKFKDRVVQVENSQADSLAHDSDESSRKALAEGFKKESQYYDRHVLNLNKEINRYENAVEKDQFGVDHRSKKRSFTRRRILSQELRHSATAILTSDNTLEIDELGISPALGINLGLLEAKDTDAWDEAVATGDPEKIQQAARGNWQYVDGCEEDMVMPWRDPVLHDGSVYAMRFKVDERLAGVSIHPEMTATMGADFDGDTFGVTHIKDRDVQKEWREKMNIKYNLLDARNELAIYNVGADNVEYMNEWIQDDSDNGFVKQVPWANDKLTEDPVYFEEHTPKEVMFDYIAHIEDTTLDMTDERFETFAKNRGFDYEQYDDLIDDGGPYIKDEMPEDKLNVLNEGEALYDEAYREVVDNYLYDTVSEFAEVTGQNTHNYKSRYVDIENNETIIASQREMATIGAKGKMGDVEGRNKSYLEHGVTVDQAKDVRLAQRTKVDEIGRSGSQTLKVTPALSSYTFYRGRRPINGSTVGMDVTETASQSILQIKHSPDDVPAALRFLNQSPKLFKGHGESFKEADESKPVNVRFSSDMFGKTVTEREERIADMLTGDALGPFEEAANGDDDALAHRMDRMLAEEHLKANAGSDKDGNKLGFIHADINMGVVTNKDPNRFFDESETAQYYYQEEDRINWQSELGKEDGVDIDGERLYKLSMKTIFTDAGLDITDEEVDFYHKAFREPDDSPRENAGMLRNHERNMYEHADATDIMAQYGADGLRDIIEWNDRNKGFPTKVADAYYAKPYSVDYGDVHDMTKDEYIDSRADFDVQKETVENLIEAVNEKEGVDASDAIVAQGKAYDKQDYSALSEDNRKVVEQLKGNVRETEEPRPVQEAVPASVASEKPSRSPATTGSPYHSSEREVAKEAVRTNERVKNEALSESKAKEKDFEQMDLFSDSTGTYDADPYP